MEQQIPDPKLYNPLHRKEVEHEVDLTQFKPQEHSFVQEGNFLHCRSCAFPHASQIPPGKILVKKDDEFTLIDMVIQ